MVDNYHLLSITVILPILNTTGSQFIILWELVMAGCVAATLPIILAFLRFQDKFMSRIAIGTVKE